MCSGKKQAKQPGKKHKSQPAKENIIKSTENGLMYSDKEVSVQSDIKDRVQPGQTDDLTKPASHIAPIRPSPWHPIPPAKKVNTWLKELNPVVVAQKPAKPKQKKMNDFFKSLNRGPLTSTLITSPANSKEVEVLKVVK